MAQNPFGSVMDFFRGGPTGGDPQQPQQTPQGGPVTNIPGANNVVADPNNPLVPAGGTGGNQPQGEPKSPMADFAQLWDNPAPKEGQPATTDWNDPMSIVPSFNLDPAKMRESAGKINFAGVMNPESVKKALSGDTMAFGEVINSVMQASFTNSALLMQKFVDSAFRGMAPKLLNEALPHHIKRHGVNEGLGAKNPIFNDPAVAPLLEALKLQLQTKNPRAPASEITRLAEQYLSNFANAVGSKGGNGAGGAGGGNGTTNPTQNQEVDWLNEFLPEFSQPQRNVQL